MSRDRDLAQENQECYAWIRDNGGSEFINLASECDSFARGEQWDAKTVAALKRRRKPHLTINKVLATYSALKGEQLARGGDVSFRASAGGDPAVARIIDKLWLNFSHSQNREWLEAEQFGDGIIRARGFLDLRISFDEAMRGEPSLSYLNSKDVGLYPGDHGMDPDNWTGVLVNKWLSPRDISEMYGIPLKDVLYLASSSELDSDMYDWRKDSFGTMAVNQEASISSDDQRSKYKLLRVLERQEWEYKTVPCFVDMNTGEVREIPTTWEKERIHDAMMQYGYNLINRRMKKINWVVSTGDLLLHSAISPYRHFTPVPYFPFIIGGRPVGIVEQLRDPQNLLNKTLSQELHIVAGIANSGYKVRQGAMTNMNVDQLRELGGEDGIVIEINGNLDQVEKLQPNAVPTGIDRLSYAASEAMQQISLVNDSMQGLNRADEAGKAIERKALQGSSALSPIFVSLDQSRRLLARNWLDLVQQYITEERIYHTTSRARTAKPEQVTVNEEQWDGSFVNDLTIGEYSIQVTDVMSRDTYDQNQFDIMMQMMRLGAPIPWSEVVNSLTILENREEIVELLKAQEGRAEASDEEKAMKDLDMRRMAAEAADKEASAAVKQAQAAKAQEEAKVAGQPKGGENAEIELAKSQQDAYLKQQDMQLKSDLAQTQVSLKQQDAQAKLSQMEKKASIDERVAMAKLAFEQRKQEEELRFMREKFELELEKLRLSMGLEREKAQMALSIEGQRAQMQQTVSQQNAELAVQQGEQKLSLAEREAKQKADLAKAAQAQAAKAAKMKSAEKVDKPAPKG